MCYLPSYGTFNLSYIPCLSDIECELYTELRDIKSEIFDLVSDTESELNTIFISNAEYSIHYENIPLRASDYTERKFGKYHVSHVRHHVIFD